MRRWLYIGGAAVGVFGAIFMIVAWTHWFRWIVAAVFLLPTLAYLRAAFPPRRASN